MTITEAWAIWPNTSRKRLEDIVSNYPDQSDNKLVESARILLCFTGIHGTKTLNPTHQDSPQ